MNPPKTLFFNVSVCAINPFVNPTNKNVNIKILSFMLLSFFYNAPQRLAVCAVGDFGAASVSPVTNLAAS
jgi:hypothetical protein